MRHVIWIVTLAVFLGYDFIYSNGRYTKLAFSEAESFLRMIRSAVTGLF